MIESRQRRIAPRASWPALCGAIRLGAGRRSATPPPRKSPDCSSRSAAGSTTAAAPPGWRTRWRIGDLLRRQSGDLFAGAQWPECRRRCRPAADRLEQSGLFLWRRVRSGVLAQANGASTTPATRHARQSVAADFQSWSKYWFQSYAWRSPGNARSDGEITTQRPSRQNSIATDDTGARIAALSVTRMSAVPRYGTRLRP